MFWGIWFLIDRDDWWSKSAEVLVSFKDTTIHNPPTDYIFQSAMSVMIVEVYIGSVSGLLAPLHGCWLNHTHLANIQIHLDSAFEYAFYHISFFWLANLFSYKKELSGQQQPQSKSSWLWSGSPWHTKHKGFLVMEYAAAFLTWKLQLVYCMYFTAMEPCYSSRESTTRYYWSNWLPIYSVSWVSLNYRNSGLELILFKVLICMEASSDLNGSDRIMAILG